MATTTNYGWEIPDDTDLVKDGAAAIRELGQDIDTTVFGLPSGGLTLISNTSFSGVATINVSNVFDSTYSRYKIMINTVATSANQPVTLRFRENVTDKATGYSAGTAQVSQTGTTTFTGTADQTEFTIITNMSTTANSIFVCDLFWSATAGIISGQGWNPQGGNALTTAGHNTAMSNFTGFTLLKGTGTLTGNVKVYGYQES